MSQQQVVQKAFQSMDASFFSYGGKVLSPLLANEESVMANPFSVAWNGLLCLLSVVPLLELGSWLPSLLAAVGLGAVPLMAYKSGISQETRKRIYIWFYLLAVSAVVANVFGALGGIGVCVICYAIPSLLDVAA